MGMTEVYHVFESQDWRDGIRVLQEKAAEYYGYQDGYSGAINSITDFKQHRPAEKLSSQKALHDYVERRMREQVNKWEAEVIDLGVIGYAIIKPVVIDYLGHLSVDLADLRRSKEPAILIDPQGRLVEKGKVAQLKERGKEKIRYEQFKNDYFIVSKNTNKVYRVTGDMRIVKTTTKRSDRNQLIRPIHKYVVYGKAPS